MTCVVTEFMAPFVKQETPFMATIELFALEQIREMLEEHLKDYIKFHHDSLDDIDEEEKDERRRQAQTAFEAFYAMFGSKSQFRNEESACDFLNSGTLADHTEILSLFILWTEELIQSQELQAGSIILTARTADELNFQLEPWVTTNSVLEDEEGDRISSWWPIVRIVRVGLQSLLLKRGIIIADLPGNFATLNCMLLCLLIDCSPGLGDTNQIRIKTTERYIRECDYYFLVAPIARIQTDESVHQRLGKAHKIFGNRKALIATKIDVRHVS